MYRKQKLDFVPNFNSEKRLNRHTAAARVMSVEFPLYR